MDTLAQFRDTYITECLELLAQMEEELMELDESASADKLNAIFRCAHSIKGGAGAFGFTAIAGFTHILEALLDKLREGELVVSRELTDLLLKSRDIVLQMVIAVRDGVALAEGFGAEIEAQLKAVCQGGVMAPVEAPASVSVEVPQEAGDTVYHITFEPLPTLINTGNEPLLLLRELARLGTAKVECLTDNLPKLADIPADICHLQWKITLETDHPESAIREVFEFVEDECRLSITKESVECHPERAERGGISVDAIPILAEKEEIPRRVASLGMTNTENTPPSPPTREIASSIRVDIDKVDRLINMVGEIVITQAMLAMQSRDLPVQQYPDLVRGIDELTQHTRELQEAVMAVRMQPVKSIFSRMPRIVRDLSAQLGKDIRMEMAGEGTEVDKTIIEQLSDPLTHMIRNSVDHGVEMPEARLEKGKPAQGCIKLSAEHRGGKIMITIADDGQGINRERVLAKAREKGVIAPDAQLADHEIDMLIFAAGFSTAEKVTNVSGRGVGMDVVKRNIESLGGTVTKAGGMNHFLLPDTGDASLKYANESSRYGVFAMEQLINGMLKLGARKDRIEVKVFGGANVINNSSMIGSKNVAFVRDFLKREGLKISGSDLGEDYPRRLRFYPDTGKAMLLKLRRKEDMVVMEEEKRFADTLKAKPMEGGIELF